MKMEEFFGITLGIVIGLIILREVWCWYFKINKIISVQKEQNELLQKLLDKNGESLENKQ